MIIAMDNGDSPYNKRHSNGHFDRKSFPFGCLIDFMPLEVVLQLYPKFHKKAVPGLYLGYAQHVGGKWPGDDLACPLDDFQVENQSRTVRIFRIKAIVVGSEYIFLLREINRLCLPLHGDFPELFRQSPPKC